MDFINDILRLFRRGCILLPAFGIGAGKVNDHAPAAVEAAGTGIRVSGFLQNSLHRDRIIIVYTIQILRGRPEPYAVGFF